MDVYEWPGLRHAFGFLDQALFAPAPGLTPLSNGTNSPVFGYKASNGSIRRSEPALNRIVPFHEYIDGFMTGRTLTSSTAREVTGAMLTLMQAAWSRDVYTSYPVRNGADQYLDRAPNETLFESHVALLSACTADDDPTHRAVEDFGNTPKLKTDARPFFMVGGTNNLGTTRRASKSRTRRHFAPPIHCFFARDASAPAQDTVTCDAAAHEDFRLALALLLWPHLSKHFACNSRRPMRSARIETLQCSAIYQSIRQMVNLVDYSVLEAGIRPTLGGYASKLSRLEYVRANEVSAACSGDRRIVSGARACSRHGLYMSLRRRFRFQVDQMHL